MTQFKTVCRKTVNEGIVLIRNENNILPLKTQTTVSIFGRIQTHYIKSGTGSGGLVHIDYVVGIPEGLKNAGISINEELACIYDAWELEHPYERGTGFKEPWYQEEMPLTDAIVKSAAEKSDIAIVILGRNAGEGVDHKVEKGSFLLTEKEEDMLSKVTTHFDRVVVLLNVGNIIDMKWVEKYQPSAVAYIWQGGQEGGNGVADVLTGKISPSGKLTDTIAHDIWDYASTKGFGDERQDYYSDDIYVGYRYFTTFAKDKILYPFGFGLSYTEFAYSDCLVERNGDEIVVALEVKNIGECAAKEVVQVYASAPQGKLGKPERVLVAYHKTATLQPNESEKVKLTIKLKNLASYDDVGVTGHKSCFVLEKGRYDILISKDSVTDVYKSSFEIEDDVVLEQCQKAMSPVEDFERIRPVVENGAYKIEKEMVHAEPIDVQARMQSNMPVEIAYTGDIGILLSDVKDGKHTMDEFIAQLPEEELACIVFGEGMNSPKVTAGTGCAFGGVTASLFKKGVPLACGTDGPSGLRMDSGAKATLMPSGTLLASTWNDDLVEELFECEGNEMTENNIDALLGPGMNIHRSPLCGRNFEYFSEDPLLSGRMALANCKGIAKTGNTATIKHFCCNNQEFMRRKVNAVVSERALREIYLRPFEMVVKAGDYCKAIMTSYNKVNDCWSVANYDLNTTVLRKDWGYQGFVMSDWWAQTTEEYERKPGMNRATGNDHVPVAWSQNDIFMVCEDATDTSTNTLFAALEDGRLNRAILQRNAKNICNYLMHSRAMERHLAAIQSGDCDYPGDVKAGEILYEVTEIQAEQEIEFDCPRKQVYVLKVELLSGGMELSQNTLNVYANGEYKVSFTVCGASGKAVTVMKKVELSKGINKIVMTYPTQVLQVEKACICEKV